MVGREEDRKQRHRGPVLLGRLGGGEKGLWWGKRGMMCCTHRKPREEKAGIVICRFEVLHRLATRKIVSMAGIWGYLGV